MPPSTGIFGRSRDLGISGGPPGKGDANRTTDVAQFKRNYDEIFWLQKAQVNADFQRRGGKLVKTYRTKP